MFTTPLSWGCCPHDFISVASTILSVSFRFDAEHFPQQRVYRLVLDLLREADPEQIFEYPVNPELAPLYSPRCILYYRRSFLMNADPVSC